MTTNLVDGKKIHNSVKPARKNDSTKQKCLVLMVYTRYLHYISILHLSSLFITTLMMYVLMGIWALFLNWKHKSRRLFVAQNIAPSNLKKKKEK